MHVSISLPISNRLCLRFGIFFIKSSLQFITKHQIVSDHTRISFIWYHFIKIPYHYTLFIFTIELLHGDVGLLVTDMPKEDIESLFNAYEDSDFSRTGSTAVETLS